MSDLRRWPASLLIREFPAVMTVREVACSTDGRIHHAECERRRVIRDMSPLPERTIDFWPTVVPENYGFTPTPRVCVIVKHRAPQSSRSDCVCPLRLGLDRSRARRIGGQTSAHAAEPAAAADERSSGGQVGVGRAPKSPLAAERQLVRPIIDRIRERRVRR